MFKKLDDYLRSVGRYLAVKDGADDILAEIRSHILDKAETDFGDAGDASVAKVLASYGNPRAVAERYLEGTQIIAPSLKRYLLGYTGLVFAAHATLSFLCLLFGTSLFLFPVVFIPRMSFSEFLFSLPMYFVCDLGLVGLFLYFVTQNKKNIALPWPKYLGGERDIQEPHRPQLGGLAGGIAGCALILAAILRYHTILFQVILPPGRIEPLLNPEAALFYSWLVFACAAIDTIALGIRFFWNSYAVLFAKNTLILIMWIVIWNGAVQARFVHLGNFDMRWIYLGTLAVMTVLTAGAFLNSLFHLRPKAGTQAKSGGR